MKEIIDLIFHNEPIDNILTTFSSNASFGLSHAHAKNALEKYGENRLREKRNKTYLERFIEQFKDIMILILIVAAIVSFTIALIERNPREFFEPILILLIVILNAVIGVVQENKAEKALDALKNLSAPSARVLREGKETILDASQIVPGDIIRLEAGDFIPADARLLKSVSLKSDESALTGESLPSEKRAELIVDANAPLGDRSNMVFSGCSITYGTATAIVTATGMQTEIGKIANLLNSEAETQTPLQKKLSQLGKLLGSIALVACGVIFVVGLSNGIPVLEIFMTSVSLAVSAIPEGLPAIVTIVLSIGVQRMVNKNAIIRKLPAVETLGNASVICSDKTGTLTQNRMTLVEAYADGISSSETISTSNSPDIKKLLTYATLCCNGTVIFHPDREEHIGDPTETAIILAAHKNGIHKTDIEHNYPRLAELPFDSDRKLMTTVHNIDGQLTAIVKGAFDVLASRCIAGNLVTAGLINDQMSEHALRVLAVAYKTLDTLPNTNSKDLENNLTFLGLVGMIDPPRSEAKEAVKICRKAGIKPVMITGDHVITASAIAKELGILLPGDKSITGTQLDAMTDSELDLQIERISVYARVSPENKIRIVKAWQRKEHVVAMTGDGVNDAPALKAADIGCAMGITGTDVAKSASDMTLTDDNFATIVDAIREGRGIYANIKKVVGFLLGTNIGEVVAVFTSMLLWHESPFLSMQLLWINLVTDSLPAIALGMEPVESDIMTQSPKPKREGLFARGFGIRIVLQGLMFGILAILAFRIGKATTGELAAGQTLAFMVLSLSQVIQAFNMRSEHSLFAIGIFSNHKLNWAALSSILLICLVLFTPFSVIFGLVYLTVPHYIIGLSLIVLPILVMELAKTFV